MVCLFQGVLLVIEEWLVNLKLRILLIYNREQNNSWLIRIALCIKHSVLAAAKKDFSDKLIL
jgi:hypothetical protein